MSQIAPIETSHLIIRPFSMEDLPSVHNILDIELEDADFGTKGTQTLQERERWLQWTILNYEQLARLNQPPYGDRAIVHKNENEVIGVCGFVPCLDCFEQLCDLDQNTIQTTHGITSPEFGLFYAIGKNFQGKGFGTEAASAMTSYAFNHLHVRRIIATTTYDNTQSISVMRKLGMHLKKNSHPSPAWLQVVGILDNPDQNIHKMGITLERATSEDVDALHAIQIKSFLPLLEKYKDEDTNPACESLEKTLNRINDPLRGFYKILKDSTLVGGISIKHTAPGTLFLGPIFIDPDFQNQKIAQKALKLIEAIFPAIDFFELSTKKEKSNVHLYEKIGYVATGESKKINNLLDVIFFRKKIVHFIIIIFGSSTKRFII